MEQPTNESGPEPVDGSETPKVSPEKSPSLSMPELLEKMRKLGWEVNPGEFSAILPGRRVKPEADDKQG